MTDLTTYVTAHIAESEEVVSWPPSQLRLRSYITTLLPPDDLIVSVRAVIRIQEAALLVRNSDEQHILPGGRREANETFEDTVKREVLEESGWSVIIKQLLGVRHFRHLTPRPPKYVYPYPDFFQLVYLAQPLHYRANYRQEGEYEENAQFVAREELTTILLAPDQHVWLRASDKAGTSSV